jgi:hypothetical protein
MVSRRHLSRSMIIGLLRSFGEAKASELSLAIASIVR